MADDKKEPTAETVDYDDLKKRIDSGEITINQARKLAGLKTIDDPAANERFIKM